MYFVYPGAPGLVQAAAIFAQAASEAQVDAIGREISTMTVKDKTIGSVPILNDVQTLMNFTTQGFRL